MRCLFNFISIKFLLTLLYPFTLFLSIYSSLCKKPTPVSDLPLDFYLGLSLKSSKKIAPEVYQKLQELQNRLPNREKKEAFKKWWQTNRKTWREDLRKIMIEHRNIGHDWQFNRKQQELLKQYYRANQLVTQCLHRECYVSIEMRKYIEETILLPIAEIEKYGNPQLKSQSL